MIDAFDRVRSARPVEGLSVLGGDDVGFGTEFNVGRVARSREPRQDKSRHLRSEALDEKSGVPRHVSLGRVLRENRARCRKRALKDWKRSRRILLESCGECCDARNLNGE